jgi:small subunit ribosomal protein SAe
LFFYREPEEVKDREEEEGMVQEFTPAEYGAPAIAAVEQWTGDGGDAVVAASNWDAPVAEVPVAAQDWSAGSAGIDF